MKKNQNMMDKKKKHNWFEFNPST